MKKDNGIKLPIKEIKNRIELNKKQIEISWVCPYQDVNYFIYRGEKGNPVSFYKIISKEQIKFEDKNIKINVDYQYMIKAIFTDGSESVISEKIIGKL